eukprot:scaffold69593_cov66-Cyclotella_meneghiniana.AAC.1
MVSGVQATNKFLTEHGDGHLTSDHYVIGDIFLCVAYREVSPIAACCLLLVVSLLNRAWYLVEMVVCDTFYVDIGTLLAGGVQLHLFSLYHSKKSHIHSHVFDQ